MRLGSDLIRTWSCSLLRVTHHPLAVLGTLLFLPLAWTGLSYASSCLFQLLNCAPVTPAPLCFPKQEPSNPCGFRSPVTPVRAPAAQKSLQVPLVPTLWLHGLQQRSCALEASKIITGSVLVSFPGAFLSCTWG